MTSTKAAVLVYFVFALGIAGLVALVASAALQDSAPAQARKPSPSPVPSPADLRAPPSLDKMLESWSRAMSVEILGSSCGPELDTRRCDVLVRDRNRQFYGEVLVLRCGPQACKVVYPQ